MKERTSISFLPDFCAIRSVFVLVVGAELLAIVLTLAAARGLASPDAADAIAVTFAFPVAHREYNERTTQRRNAQNGPLATSWMGA